MGSGFVLVCWKKVKVNNKKNSLNLIGQTIQSIDETKGLATLTKLKKLDLSTNPINDLEKHYDSKNIQALVKYCQSKKKQ